MNIFARITIDETGQSCINISFTIISVYFIPMVF